MGKKILFTLAAAVFLQTGAAGAEMSAAARVRASVEMRTLAAVNDARAGHGLAPLRMNWEVARAARVKAEDMAGLDYLDPVSPAQGSPADMLARFGIPYGTAGANLGRGQRAPGEAVRDWARSPAHRANMLSGAFTQAGVGVYHHGNTTYWTIIFIS